MYSTIAYKATSGPVLIKSGLDMTNAKFAADVFYSGIKEFFQKDLTKSGIAVMIVNDSDFESLKNDPPKPIDKRIISQYGFY